MNIIDEATEPQCEDVMESRRGRGRPKKARTGRKRRPKKLYQPVDQGAEIVAAPDTDVTKNLLLAEVPMKQAITDPDCEEAMAFEIKSVIQNDTWKMIDHPADGETIGSRIVLQNKMKTDGTFERRKASLVAQGFNQNPRIHFSDFCC